MGGRNLRTLSELARHGADLRLTCAECGHEALLSPFRLQETLGADADLWRLPFACRACGSRNVLRWAEREGEGRKLPPNVVAFPGSHAERVLKTALKANLATAVVIGQTRDGEPYSAASTNDVGSCCG
jgi:NAD-dependent SIR2 family protein deacetylase